MRVMENTTLKQSAAVEILERATQVLELTYHEWRLHEQPANQKKKRHRRSLTMNRTGGRAYSLRSINAFA